MFIINYMYVLLYQWSSDTDNYIKIIFTNGSN